MPRKSLPTATPKHHPLPARSHSTLKRSSTTIILSPTRSVPSRNKWKDTSPDPIALVDEDEDPEKELEAWQDFAAEHYEMVEQLPLELHRNFRLLRELDEGCSAQTDKLQALIRSYIAQRLVPSKPAAEPNDIAAAGDVDTSEPPSLKGPDDIPQDAGEGLRQVVEEMGIPLPDGAGGLCLPPPADDESEAEAVEEVEGRREFPRAEAVGEATSTLKQPDPSLRNSHPYDTLPDIGRLAREIVRNGEEKLAVAVGAYNSIDRHIRALDSALSAQEASILLGLRPATLPSTAVDDSFNLAPLDIAEGGEAEDGEVTIGLGGGGARKGRKGRKGRKVKVEDLVAEVQEETGGFPAAPMDIDADPNEPRYCYCHQVSYGKMIGCENDECPHEWFHLACAGLHSPPNGKWYCNVCRPKIGLGKGGSGAVQPKTVSASRGRKK